MPQVALGAALVGGAIATAGSVAALTGITLAVAQIGTGLVLSGIAQQFQDLPEAPARTVSIRQAAAPRDLVFGTVRKGGTLIFAHSVRDGGSDYLHLIYALAGHEIERIDAIYFGDKLAWQRTSLIGSPAGVQPRYSDSLQVDYRLGTSTQSAITNARLPTNLWGPDHRCLGVPLLYLRLRGESDDYPNGIPNVSVLMRGYSRIYDPRTGTTGWTDNAALCAAAYLNDAKYGLGLPYGSKIDTSSLIEAANVCDEIVNRNPSAPAPSVPQFQIFPVVGGATTETQLTGQEKRYTVNGVLSSAAQPKQICEAFLSAMAGMMVPAAGKWRIHAGAYRVPTVTLTADDLRSGSVRVATRRPRAQLYNGVRGTFVSPENNWQEDDFPAYASSVYRAEDQGVESWRDIELPLTTSSATAQRLAKINLELLRRQQVMTWPGKMSAFRAATGETVLVNFAPLGYSAKPFDMRKIELAAAGDGIAPDLVLSETSPLVYSWTATEEQIYEAAPPTNLPDPFQIAAPGAPQIAEELYLTRTGTVEAKAVISWSPSEGPFLSFYELQVRRISGGTSPPDLVWRTIVRTSEAQAEQLAIEAGVTYEWRVQAVNTFGTRSLWATASQRVSGLNAPPVALTNVTIQSAGNMAVLKWSLPTDLDVRIGGRVLIRHTPATVSPSWANSVSVDEVAGSTTTATVPLKPGTYLLRAADARGFQGPVATVATKGATWVPFANLQVITESPTFPGAKSNVSVVSSTLRLTNVATEGVYTFNTGLDLGLEKAVRLRSVIDVSAISLTSTIDQRTDPIDTWPDFDGTEGADTDVIVEVRTTDDDPGGSPVWSGWTRLDATEEAFRGAQFRARLISRSADYAPAILSLSVRVDEAA